MISVEKKIYPADWPLWMKNCPICHNNPVGAIVTIESDSINRVHFAICDKCRKELSDKLRKF